MKIYMIYNYVDGEFEFVTMTGVDSIVKAYINERKDKQVFIRVDNFTYYEAGRRAGTEVLVGCKVFLRGEQICSNYELNAIDIEREIKKLLKVYHTDGKVEIFPNRVLSVPDVKEVLSIPEDEWFNIEVIEQGPDRYAIITYDWKQYKTGRVKELNKKASKMFGMELYGDVIFINENYIA